MKTISKGAYFAKFLTVAFIVAGFLFIAPISAFAAQTITVSAGANGTINPPGPVSVVDNGVQPFFITANAYNHILDVLVDDVSVGAVGFYMFSNVVAPHTIAATFEANAPHTIAASAGANGSVSPSGAVIVADGGNTTFAITPSAGFSIADVLVDGVSVGAAASHTFTDTIADHTLVASFAANAYTVTASAGANGSVSPSGAMSVNGGTNQTFAITPSAGFSVADVLVDGISVGAVSSHTFINVTGNHTLAASFAVTTHAITASAGANGSLTPSGITNANEGSDQAFAIAANSGYHIADVLVDGVSVGAMATYTFTNITVPHTISATFAADPAPVTPPSGGGGGGGGYAPPSGSYSDSYFPRSYASAPAVMPIPAVPVVTPATVATPVIAQEAATPATASSLSLHFGSRGDAVIELQKRLTAEGVYSGPITGYFGPLTRAAVIAYQSKNGVPAVGVVGPLTRAKLAASLAKTQEQKAVVEAPAVQPTETASVAPQKQLATVGAYLGSVKTYVGEITNRTALKVFHGVRALFGGK